MKQKLKKKIFFLIIIIFFYVLPFFTSIKNTSAGNPGPYFSISVIASAEDPLVRYWSTLLVEYLPKLGIQVDVFEQATWEEISEILWNNEGSYPIPAYRENGYDLICYSKRNPIDFNPNNLFYSSNSIPVSNNIYQYQDELMDEVINNFNSSNKNRNRCKWAKEIQKILYDEIPAISIIYEKDLYPCIDGLSGFDGTLLTAEFETMECWEIESSNELNFAYSTLDEIFHPLISGYWNKRDYNKESVTERLWLGQIFSGLSKRDANSKIFNPHVASTYSSNDGLLYTVELDSDAKFADGTKVTFEDIEYSYKLAITKSLSKSQCLTNSEFWNNNSFEKINENIFTIEFNQPWVYQEKNLAVPILPKAIWESIEPENHFEISTDWAINHPERIFGTGPYRLESYNPITGEIHLTKNYYFSELSAGSESILEDIIFLYYPNKNQAMQNLKSGKLQIIDSKFGVTKSEVEEEELSYQTSLNLKTHELAVNMNNPWLGTGENPPIGYKESSKYIRKAISSIIPRDFIAEMQTKGLTEPGITPWPSGAFGFTDDLQPYEFSINWGNFYMNAAGFDIVPHGLSIYQQDFFLPLIISVCILIPVGIFITIYAIKFKREDKKRNNSNL
ncbi:MAG: hypothetical protein EAX90_12780 [Candidatus Heimdallarchaeota archaeon]|nr:hypothetical protein [Candidatus Heimdallarchaeota archaeon]